MGYVYRIFWICLLCCWLPAAVSAADISLKEGDKGKEVAEIQLKLKEKGYTVKKVDGIFTADTSKAVKAFQEKSKLKPTGIVDAKTYGLLLGKNMVSAGKGNPKTQQIINTSLQYLGVPYKFGGTTPKGFDCSGFTQYVFSKNGISLPRAADIQYKTGKAVARNELRQGDLVFFTTYESGASHVGIYTDGGRFIHASSSKGVMISRLDDVYWKPRYVGAKRMVLF